MFIDDWRYVWKKRVNFWSAFKCPNCFEGECALGLAIGAMQILKCIHPLGGATAFTAVMGGEAIHALGF